MVTRRKVAGKTPSPDPPSHTCISSAPKSIAALAPPLNHASFSCARTRARLRLGLNHQRGDMPRPVGGSGPRLPSMPGPVALIGAGEFLHAMAAFDAHLLAATGRAHPRVAIVPTASFPDGEAVFRRSAAMGIEHFSRLGAEVEA